MSLFLVEFMTLLLHVTLTSVFSKVINGVAMQTQDLGNSVKSFAFYTSTKNCPVFLTS